jgi:hypothetical protein
MMGTLLRLLLSGSRGVRRRDDLNVWCGERRADPEPDA